uniref:Uncharacterized protein n=1 Tax=Aegilops tauschii subsp. strangulata TaxID=200361 RepID=A0A453BHS2_AEGTS
MITCLYAPYSRSILLVAQTGVSSTEIRLGTSIRETSNMDRRDYLF